MLYSRERSDVLVKERILFRKGQSMLYDVLSGSDLSGAVQQAGYLFVVGFITFGFFKVLDGPKSKNY